MFLPCVVLLAVASLPLQYQEDEELALSESVVVEEDQKGADDEEATDGELIFEDTEEPVANLDE